MTRLNVSIENVLNLFIKLDMIESLRLENLNPRIYYSKEYCYFLKWVTC